ncbi:MAG: histidine triad nucleotide-binding protein [Brevinematales bacterium]|nr:histidine triad nucleotide-binding protein [Brevinematales bacterium]
MDCIFCKIATKEIKSSIVYEDEFVLAFNDINPQAPIHIVVIPKEHIATLNDVIDFGIYEKIFKAINKIVKELKIDKDGYRVVANCNRNGGQTVFHIHFHILAGRYMEWPPG